MQRHDVAPTLRRSFINVMYLLGGIRIFKVNTVHFSSHVKGTFSYVVAHLISTDLIEPTIPVTTIHDHEMVSNLFAFKGNFPS